MAHQAFPKPVKTAKRPNRTQSKARAARRRKQEAVKRDVYALVDARDGGICARCGDAGDHHHHIIFRSQGGQHTTANVITLCNHCHRAVHQRQFYIYGHADLGVIITKEPRPCPS